MKKIFGQAIRFLGISGIGWIIDFAVFSFLSYYVSENIFADNIASSLFGAFFVFVFSTRTVFRGENGKISLRLKLIIYLIYIALLVMLVSGILGFFTVILRKAFSGKAVADLAPLISKICVTPVTMCMNFFIMKGLIEKL